MIKKEFVTIIHEIYSNSQILCRLANTNRANCTWANNNNRSLKFLMKQKKI